MSYETLHTTLKEIDAERKADLDKMEKALDRKGKIITKDKSVDKAKKDTIVHKLKFKNPFKKETRATLTLHQSEPRSAFYNTAYAKERRSLLSWK